MPVVLKVKKKNDTWHYTKPCYDPFIRQNLLTYFNTTPSGTIPITFKSQ